MATIIAMAVGLGISVMAIGGLAIKLYRFHRGPYQLADIVEQRTSTPTNFVDIDLDQDETEDRGEIGRIPTPPLPSEENLRTQQGGNSTTTLVDIHVPANEDDQSQDQARAVWGMKNPLFASPVLARFRNSLTKSKTRSASEESLRMSSCHTQP